MDLRTKDIVVLAWAFAAQRVGEQLNRSVGESASVEPALSDPPGSGEDFEASGVAPGEIEWDARSAG